MGRTVGRSLCSNVARASGLGCVLALVLGGCSAGQSAGSAGLSADPSVDSPGVGGSRGQSGAPSSGDPAAGGAGGQQGGATARRSPPPIRLLAPLSGSIDDSLRPDFRWAGGAGTVNVCRDRACQQIVASVTGPAGKARPKLPLPSGTLFWRVVTGQGPTATWQITIPHRESGRAIAFGSIPDYNGDGLADVALTTQGPTGTGAAIFFGSKSLPAQEPDVTLLGGDFFGCALATVGDTNGDGFADLGVTENCVDGPVWIYHGGAGGLVLGARLDSGRQIAGFGTTIASAGDVNGDGYGDVIVGALGAAQVYLGGPDGVSPLSAFELTPDFAPTTVQGPGDVNGDGLPDVSVGTGILPGAVFLGNGAGFTRQAFNPPVGGGNSFAGDFNGDGFVDFDSFSVLPGAPEGVDPSHLLTIEPATPVYAAAGDVDADGFGDQIELVGPGTGRPEHYRILFGAASACGGGCRFAPLSPPGLTESDFAILAGVGDVNGDGADDVVVSRPSIGTAYLYLGGSGFPGSPARTWTGPVGVFGASVPTLFGTATFFGQP